MAIDAAGGGSKQATTSDDRVPDIQEDDSKQATTQEVDSIESSSGNYSGLEIKSGISNEEESLDTSKVVS